MSDDVRVLFRELAGLAPAEREEQYERLRVKAEIRAELESLFRFDATVADSLAGVVGSAAEHFLSTNAPVPAGGRCGPYRLDRLIADGGMGAVYLAERVDGEVNQRVAIKFLRTGADLPFFRQRFLRERQILASLNHPGIARLLDAGHTGGHPYLVMEYVDGIRIDQYAAGLEIRQILALIVRVAEAVSYAHRNLVIHRDLKPSNILVDAAGQPKLLDFGIAKILDASEETRTMERMMTPEYASPEQLRGEAQATTTDIYSLGAVLGRLLALQRQTAGGLSKDLEAILSKAMRDEHDERYASMDLLIADVRAYLDHRPVQARRGSALYAARKFARRHWLPIAAGALAVAGLAGGLLLANRERAIAERRFQQVRQLSNRFLDLDAEIRPLPGSTNARKRIVSDSLEYLERLGSEARRASWGGASRPQDLDLALDVARGYLRIARVQGVPGQATLGQFAQAKASLARADSFLEGVLADPAFPRRREALFASAEAAHDGMILAETELRAGEARVLSAKASAHLDALLRAAPPNAAEARIAGQLYANLALTHQKLHQLDESAAYARRAVDMARRAGNQRLLSMSLGILANTARFAGRLDEALKAVEEAGDVATKTADRNGIEGALMLSAARWRQGVILGELNNINMGRPQEALPLLKEAFDLAEGLARKDPQDYTSRTYVSMAGRELGDLLRGHDPAGAIAVYDHTRQRLEEVRHNPKARRDQVWLLAGAAYACRALGRHAESGRRIEEAFAILRELQDYPSAKVPSGEEADAALRAKADHLADTGQLAAAIRTYEELHERMLATIPQPRLDLRHANALSRIYRDLGNLHRRAGHAPLASMLDQLRLEIWRHWDQKLPNNPFVRVELAAAQRAR